jgi:hypothetical protein
MVNKRRKTSNSDQVIIEDQRGVPITFKEIKILEKSGKDGWLNDEIIIYFFGQVILK